MLFGTIGFSYGNTAPSRQSFARTGLVSANLGDNIQTLAVRELYLRLGVPAEQITRIDRDSLTRYDGPPVVLPMNAVFHRGALPLSPKIIPLWIGFHANADTIAEHRDWLAGQGLIGCRDPATASALLAQGIAAEVTGCLTLAFAPRRAAPNPARARVLIVHGQGSGALPGAALATMPPDLLARAEFIVQRREMTALPLLPSDMNDNDHIAERLLQRYRKTALLMVTPLHHAAAPAIALGIPTVVIRREASDRFGFLQQVLQVHVGPDFSGVDWRPAPVDLATVRAAQWARFADLVRPWLTPPAA